MNANLETPNLNERRAAVLRTYGEAQNRHDISALIATFHQPRCEIVPLQIVAEGAGAVFEFWQRLFVGFPDFHTEVFTQHQVGAAVIVEGRMVGTQLGPWAGLPASGRVMNVHIVILFEFDEDRLIGQKVYYDGVVVLAQLTNSSL
jgi:steroid delta-isomerase-like uncharacterized protein